MQQALSAHGFNWPAPLTLEEHVIDAALASVDNFFCLHQIRAGIKPFQVLGICGSSHPVRWNSSAKGIRLEGEPGTLIPWPAIVRRAAQYKRAESPAQAAPEAPAIASDLFAWGEQWKDVEPRFRGHRFNVPTCGAAGPGVARLELPAGIRPSAVLRQYESMKAKLPGVLLGVELGDFFEFYGTDAETVAPIAGVMLTRRGSQPMCGFPVHSAAGYLARLTQGGQRVAIAAKTAA